MVQDNASIDIKDQVESHLRMIEASHGVKIMNSSSIVKTIAQNITDKNAAIQVCTAINTWITINQIQGATLIPENLVLKYIRTVKKKSISLR